MRISLRTALLAAVLAAPVPLGATPPAAPSEPVTDEYYGTKVVDPYRWMESGKDPRWMPWLKAQADHSRTVFDSMPGRTKMLGEISQRTGALPAVARVVAAGGVMVWQDRPAGAQDFRLMVRDGKGEPRVLLDPSSSGKGDDQVIDDWSLSPNGRHIAVLLSKRGTERSVIHVLDTATGALGPERIADGLIVRWLPDSSGFAFLHFVGEHGTPTYYVNNQARLHLLGQSSDMPIETRANPALKIDPGQWALVVFDQHGDHAYLAVRDGRSEFRLLHSTATALRAGKPDWKAIADFQDVIVDVAAAGDRLYLVTRKDNSNGRVLRVAAGNPDLSQATPIDLPGSPVIEGVYGAKSGVWVRTLEGGESSLWFVPTGGQARKAQLPYAGTIGWMENDSAKDDALIGLTGWFAPAKVLHLAENGDVHDIGFVPPLPFDVTAYEAVRATAKARDGTDIPYTLLRKKGAAAPAPLLLEAYGSYGMSMSPRFQPRILPFLDRGGVYVMANVRGGGEFGRAWHYAGKAQTKATTWRDAIAVAEQLVANGATSPAKMTILGTSAGGVMVGGAVNERPDLFSGAIANVGFMNPVRYVSEQNFADIEEWGGPIKDDASFRTMFGLDPYVHIRPGTKYPATLVVSGINDPRAATFHSAKYAARMAASTTSGEPVLLRIDFGAGHGIGSSRDQADATWADIYSFALWQAGAAEFQPR